MIGLDTFSLINFDKDIQVLRKWKIIPYKSFHVVSAETHKKTYSYKYLKRLMKEGIVKKMKLPKTNACIVIPSKFIIDEFNIPITKEQFTHDTIVSYVAASLIKLGGFQNAEFIFEHESKKFNAGAVIPDIEIIGVDQHSKDHFQLAIEIELSRKAFAKIDDKLMRYANDQTFDQVLYFFTSIELYEIFKNRVWASEENEVSKAISQKLTLVLIRDYLSLDETIMNSQCFSRGREGVLSDFF